MRIAAFFLLAVLTGFAVGCSKSKPTPAPPPNPDPDQVTASSSDKDRAQGTWVIEKVDMPGEAVYLDDLKKISGTIKGTLLTVTIPQDNEKEHLVIGFDDSRSPKEVDLTNSNEKGDTAAVRFGATGKEGKIVPVERPRKKMLGIYKFEGDTLVVAVSPPGAPRPTEFKGARRKPGVPEADSGQVVVVYLKKK
jgi:uncharacterized protein (TIGR03067 family)